MLMAVYEPDRQRANTRRTESTVRGTRRVPATTAAALAAIVLLFLIYIGSRELRDFDAALVGYAVGSVFALAAVVYRYTLWITRPPTWRYWKAGWTNFLSWRNFLHYTALIPVAWWTDIFAQTFILKRSLQRWAMHMSIFWGVLLSCAVTFPLTFGWLTTDACACPRRHSPTRRPSASTARRCQCPITPWPEPFLRWGRISPSASRSSCTGCGKPATTGRS